MGLIDVFDAVEARLTATLAGFVPPQPPPLYRRFTNEIRMEDDYPRVAWIIGPEIIVGNDQQGGDGVSNPSQIWKRQSRVTVQIWEADVPAAEVLLNHFVAAMHDTFAGNYIATAGQWNAGESTNQRGVAYRLQLTIFFALTRELSPTAIVDAFPELPVLVPIL